jgi:imidazolonepropionase-like amidohydrolase
MRVKIILLTLTLTALLFPQKNTKPVEGLRENTPNVLALTNATIVQSPGKIIKKGAIVIRNGVIETVGTRIKIPPDARIINMDGKFIYPGFIDIYTNYGMPKKKKDSQSNTEPQKKKSKGPAHWNRYVFADRLAIELFSPDKKSAEKLRSQGFTVVVTVPPDGIFKGKSAVVTLADKPANDVVVKPALAQNIAFLKRYGRDIYPGSLMGNIALIRQTFLDAQWYKEAWNAYRKNPSLERPEVNKALEALQSSLEGEPVVFKADDELDFLRCAKIIKEFSLNGWILGSGYEYRRIQAIKSTGLPIIIPLNFPEPPAIENPDDAEQISLRDLKHWYNAPENPKRLDEAGIKFAITTYRLKKVKDFLSKLREAVQRGLPEESALSALTITPAKILGLDKSLGTIEPGKSANFVITDKNIFKDDAKVLQVWIDGEKYDVEGIIDHDPRGKWKAYIDKDEFTIEISGRIKKLSGSIIKGKRRSKFTKIELFDRNITIAFDGTTVDLDGIVRISAFIRKDTIRGFGEFLDGKRFKFFAIKTEKSEKKKSRREKIKFEPLEVTYPDGAFGFRRPPEQPEYILVKNATIWTCSPLGKLENADMLIHRGIIQKIDKDITPPKNALIIDATGKHVTPGIIDAHSHMAITGGVNEPTQAITAEVRIRDVINSDDISIYRALAGGVTCANLLHGSANPIGGQNAVIKLRWGSLPDEMIFKEAPQGIKFALGENVKQSNWGDKYTTRYPQTRMGVEQIIRDAFKSALDYEKAWEEYNRAKKENRTVIPPRRDLQAEALLEILRKKRFVHAHSYRQDEILMLLKLAEDFGFRIAVLQHVLEGYKIAEAIAKHGAGASTFTDWWAYKIEVYDAIPYNGALMEKVGVITSYNSDSNELIRRLNTEAAKGVKYGGLSEEEALKLVTLNPAKQLKVDKYVGSLEPGKHADFVIWSGNPLSTYTICEQTWIDGRKYFDRKEDLKMREEVRKLRAFIIKKIFEVRSKGRKKKTEK